MPETANQDIASALHSLTIEEIDRLRLKLWRRFGGQLRNIPDAPNPDDLLHETIEDLLADRRHCPLARVNLLHCLFNIVRSKVSHLYEKWKKDKIIKEPEYVLKQTLQQPTPEGGELQLRHTILNLVADDPLLTQIVEYRLEHSDEEPIKARKIAEALGRDIQEVYNANRRLKTRLEKLIQKNN